MSGKSEQDRLNEIVGQLTASKPRTIEDKEPEIPAAERRSATYQLREDTIAGVKAIARLERFSGKQYSLIVQALLDLAITEYGAGRAKLVMVEESDGLWRPTMRHDAHDPADKQA